MEVEEEREEDLGSIIPPPPMVYLASFPYTPSPSPRRLCSHFTHPTRPISSARRMAYVSLQGCLINAEKASSATTIGGGLKLEETVAWELFTPIQRFLIVAVIGVAVSESKKNRLISKLRKSVELRDEILSSMQQKLDALCEQLTSKTNNPEDECSILMNKNVESSSFKETFGPDKFSFVDCGCWLCDHHHDLFTSNECQSVTVPKCGNDMLHYTNTPVNETETEQDERRMSDLSDWCSSVTSSSTEIQLNNLTIEQDVGSLKKECEEKDATIKELTYFLQSSDSAGAKRVSELEDIIRRKNTTITSLKKDMMVLEQKVMQLTRLRRPSMSATNSTTRQFCIMTDNVLYDMDSTTSPSSSDSDSESGKQPHVHQDINFTSPKHYKPAQKPEPVPKPAPVPFTPVATERRINSRTASPLKDLSKNQKADTIYPPRRRPVSANGDFRKTRRRVQTTSKSATTSKKRWV